jgi:two-component system, OmpR family, sensor histidine kinase MtrB
MRILRSLTRRWRRSLALRVVAITALLCLAVIWILGSALLNRVTDGLVNTKVSAALAEASDGAAQAQRRLDVVDRSDPFAIAAVIDEVASVLASAGGPAGQNEVALLRSPTAGNPVISLDRASNFVEPSSIPDELRSAVRLATRQAWTFMSITYATGESEPGLAVGSTLAVPGVGEYELYLLFPLAPEQASVDLVRRTLLLAGLALVLLVAGITWLVVYQVVTPVRMASRIAERIAAGELQERMLVQGSDDLARLGMSFNDMAASLQRQINRLEDVSRFQQRFVSDVSHELRTPLTTVRMAADVLHSSSREFDPAVARSSELLQAQLGRFESLLSDLLEISRFDAGVADLEIDAIDLRGVVNTVVEGLSPLAAQRGSTVSVEYRLESDEENLIVEGDRRRISRILRNLLENAIEYGDGKLVEILVAGNTDAVAVSVRDFGVGLRAGEANRVFDRFWRADPARARSTGGTGLGLSIALEDARLHEGWLQAWGAPNQGSQFRLTLPRHRGAPILTSPIHLGPMAMMTEKPS